MLARSKVTIGKVEICRIKTESQTQGGTGGITHSENAPETRPDPCQTITEKKREKGQNISTQGTLIDFQSSQTPNSLSFSPFPRPNSFVQPDHAGAIEPRSTLLNEYANGGTSSSTNYAKEFLQTLPLMAGRSPTLQVPSSQLLPSARGGVKTGKVEVAEGLVEPVRK